MSTETIHWFTTDQTITHEQVDELSDVFNTDEDTKIIVTHKEFEPMDQKERENYVEQLIEALDDER